MVNSDHPYQQQHQQNPYGHPYPNNNSHSQQNSHSLYYASNGNYAAVSTGRAATSTPSNNGSDSALVSIDGAEATTVTSQVLTSNNLHAMGSQNVAYNHSHHNSNSNPQPRANLFRRFPLRSILKNGKVHNSSQAATTGEESGPAVPLSQPKSGILKKATTAEAFITIGNGSIPSAAVQQQQQQQHNGGNPANSSSTSSNHPPLPILQVSPSSASSHASAKSAASLVQFAGSPSQPELPQQRKENSCDTSSPSSEAVAAMSSSAAAVPSVSTVSASAAADTSTSAVGRAYAIASAAAAAASTSQPPSHHLQQQPLSVNRLQVPPNPNHHPSTTSTTTPTPSPLSLITTTTTRPSTSSAANLTRNPSLSAIGPSASVVASNGSLQPSYYTATTTQRISDLRRILNPEVEKEDSFKKFTEAIENCDCFEFNLNNAAKLITVLVLLATLVLVIRALKGDR